MGFTTVPPASVFVNVVGKISSSQALLGQFDREFPIRIELHMADPIPVSRSTAPAFRTRIPGRLIAIWRRCSRLLSSPWWRCVGVTKRMPL
jgi:hypothetical protein